MKLGKELENVTVSEMDVPIITNVTGDYIKSKDEIKELLVRQVSSSVLFEESLKRMIADGVDTFIEIGGVSSIYERSVLLRVGGDRKNMKSFLFLFPFKMVPYIFSENYNT